MGRSVVNFSSSEILPIAESTGFKSERIEKVLHLMNLLTTLNSHPYLKGKWVLKGLLWNLHQRDMIEDEVDMRALDNMIWAMLLNWESLFAYFRKAPCEKLKEVQTA